MLYEPHRAAAKTHPGPEQEHPDTQHGFQKLFPLEGYTSKHFQRTVSALQLGVHPHRVECLRTKCKQPVYN